MSLEALSAFNSAVAAFNKNDWAKAEKLSHKALYADRWNAKAHEILALCCYFQNRLSDAEHAARNAIAIEKHADFFFTLGLILSKASKHEGAAEAYQELLALDPKSIATYNNLAYVYLNLGRRPEATELFRKATEIQPDFAIGYINLGMCLFEQRRYAEAVTALEKALSLNPLPANIAGVLAEALTELQRFDEAMAVSRSAGLWGQLQFDKRRILSWDELAEIDEQYLRTIYSQDFKPSLRHSALLKCLE
ncbi:MAG: tetratricopeptide repeat protein [Mesorhizobium sp.]